ncbi:MAG: LysM peptidoglycan-binding domain-containing protein [Chloroflexi bacterium]|nr:LysM peptidoglycan-binding domain-containing protein [Chloroflexota bacterium]
MKKLRILFSFIVVFMITAVACNQENLPEEIVLLPPTTTAVSLPQSTLASHSDPTVETISPPPTATATITATLTTYTIQPGDTLLTIGRRFEVTVEELAETNDLPNDAIFAGQTLVIPEQAVEETAVSSTNLSGITATPTTQTNSESETGDNDLEPTGRLELTHPQTMIVAESGVITVEIIADPELAEIGEHEPHVTGIVRVEASYVDGERAHYEQTIELFPLMAAELNAPAFDVFPSGGDNVRLPRAISTSLPAVWTWDIIATTPGEQQIITVNLYKEAEGENSVPILTNSISRKINVSSKSRWSQIADSLADNVLLLLGTGGPLGLLLAYATYRASKENEQLKKEVAHFKESQTTPKNRDNAAE